MYKIKFIGRQLRLQEVAVWLHWMLKDIYQRKVTTNRRLVGLVKDWRESFFA